MFPELGLRIESTVFSSARTIIHTVRANDNKVYALKIFEDVAQFNEKYEEYVGLNHQNVCRILKLAVANGNNAKKHIVV